MMPAWWPVIVFGLPGIVASLLVSTLGIYFGRPLLLCLGAVLAMPSAYYLGGQPDWWPALVLLPAMHLLAAAAVWRARRLLAACALLPNAAAALWFAMIMIRE